jgi:hypothetical protein
MNSICLSWLSLYVERKGPAVWNWRWQVGDWLSNDLLVIALGGGLIIILLVLAVILFVRGRSRGRPQVPQVSRQAVKPAIQSRDRGRAVESRRDVSLTGQSDARDEIDFLRDLPKPSVPAAPAAVAPVEQGLRATVPDLSDLRPSAEESSGDLDFLNELPPVSTGDLDFLDNLPPASGDLSTAPTDTDYVPRQSQPVEPLAWDFLGEPGQPAGDDLDFLKDLPPAPDATASMSSADSAVSAFEPQGQPFETPAWDFLSEPGETPSAELDFLKELPPAPDMAVPTSSTAAMEGQPAGTPAWDFLGETEQAPSDELDFLKELPLTPGIAASTSSAAAMEGQPTPTPPPPVILETLGVRALVEQINQFILHGRGEIEEAPGSIRLSWPKASGQGELLLEGRDEQTILINQQPCPANLSTVQGRLVAALKEIGL